jgi:hypothetical protein
MTDTDTDTDLSNSGAADDDPLNDPETRALLAALCRSRTCVRVLYLRRGDRGPRSMELHNLGLW